MNLINFLYVKPKIKGGELMRRIMIYLVGFSIYVAFRMFIG
jgi:hypothetical protein